MGTVQTHEGQRAVLIPAQRAVLTVEYNPVL
jgi:hypothetical protein